mmetsp:Transcript_31223/g.68565  ORF Transcript_31223/g.68565 Transcript_31223/m.68565 type:complete len:90 (-) Transcript_31223:143-412(-)
MKVPPLLLLLLLLLLELARYVDTLSTLPPGATVERGTGSCSSTVTAGTNAAAPMKINEGVSLRCATVKKARTPLPTVRYFVLWEGGYVR